MSNRLGFPLRGAVYTQLATLIGIVGSRYVNVRADKGVAIWSKKCIRLAKFIPLRYFSSRERLNNQ